MTSPVVDHSPSSAETSVYDEKDASGAGLLSKLASDVGELMQTEAALARSEINESVSALKTGMVALVTGAVVLLPGVLMVLAAVALMLTTFLSLSLWLSTLITGVVVCVVGLVMLKGGEKKLSVEELAPSRTQRSLEKDKAMIERKMQ